MKKILGGVYFLYNKGELVYIGKSNNIFYRIGTHIHENIKEFDEWKYHEIEDETQRTKTEAYLISIYKPKYNQQIIQSCEVDYHYIQEGEHTNSFENMKEYEDMYWYVDVNWICEYLGYDCKYEIVELINTKFIPESSVRINGNGRYEIKRKWIMDNWNKLTLKIIEIRGK